MPLALVVPLVACRDGPTGPPSDAVFARGVSERPDALRTRAALLRDPFVRAIPRLGTESPIP